MPLTKTKQQDAIIKDIINIAEFFNLKRYVECSDDKLTIRYDILGRGSAISQRIDDVMAEKYPHQDFRIKMSPSDFILEFYFL